VLALIQVELEEKDLDVLDLTDVLAPELLVLFFDLSQVGCMLVVVAAVSLELEVLLALELVQLVGFVLKRTDFCQKGHGEVKLLFVLAEKGLQELEHLFWMQGDLLAYRWDQLSEQLLGLWLNIKVQALVQKVLGIVIPLVLVFVLLHLVLHIVRGKRFDLVVHRHILQLFHNFLAVQVQLLLPLVLDRLHEEISDGALALEDLEAHLLVRREGDLLWRSGRLRLV
jgi:hypothetical protein